MAGTGSERFATDLRMGKPGLMRVLLSALCLGAPPILHAQDRLVEGLWGSELTAPEHPSWRLEDRALGAGPRIGYEHLSELLADPANDERPLDELAAEARQMGQRHARGMLLAPPANRPGTPDTGNAQPVECEPLPMYLLLMGPQPFSIELADDAVVIRHEAENTIRRIVFGEGGEDADTSSRFGTAVARFEGETLVIESSGIAPMPLPMGAVTTDALRLGERFTPDVSDPNRLEYDVIIEDPAILREPLIIMSPRVRMDGELFVDTPCELTSGEFENQTVEESGADR